MQMDTWITSNLGDERAQNILGAMATTISNILPISLLKECGAQYGKDPKEGNYLARPYDAPESPKSTMYSDAYEQLVHALQLTLYYGVPQDACLKILTKMQAEAKDEMKEYRCML